MENFLLCIINIIIYYECNDWYGFGGAVCKEKFEFGFIFYDLVLMDIYSEFIIFLP